MLRERVAADVGCAGCLGEIAAVFGGYQAITIAYWVASPGEIRNYCCNQAASPGHRTPFL